MENKYQLVKIKWEDAVANANWFNYSEVQGWAANSRCEVEEVGYLIFQNKDYAILASAIAKKTPLAEEKIGQLHLIPNSVIISLDKIL